MKTKAKKAEAKPAAPKREIKAVLSRAEEFRRSVNETVNGIRALADELALLRQEQRTGADIDAYLAAAAQAEEARWRAHVTALDAKTRMWRARGEAAEARVKELLEEVRAADELLAEAGRK